MTNPNVRGRHRAPGRHHPLTELKAIARESAQPAMKGAAVVAAAGGLVATFATPAGADTLTAADTNVAVAAVAAPAAPAVVGPATATPDTATDLASFGFAAPTAAKAKAAKPQVIEDVVVKAQRAEAARVIAAKAASDARAKSAARAADRTRTAAKAAASQRESSSQRSSRSTTRRTLTSSTSATKSSSNSYTPQASSGSRSGRNWATPGQCTWGALAQWYASEGYYPSGWTGNALVWGSGAARSGYTVSSTPRARSILVMQPGVHGSSSYAGHVAWVTSVSGSSVTIIEMNALAGAYRYNTRTLTSMGGMRYIYAP
ncbi:CHAP domain-containing protein [Humibacillus sp. DSM 29435]|uniref:CHAP domain-containing protein n=1 Tax=Humibacillus sp. DSM 29435 TaxID=1869167 RepID=UPI0008720AD1|nr:CHAP domain-containing protein [Humibacillus sp. DSM 29435]OFE16223.1 CHAP domain-containing protein [Humibacillus sp. DSM 29435]